MKVSIVNDSEKREYVAYVVVVTTPEFEDGRDFNLSIPSDYALFQFLRHSAEGLGCGSKPYSIVDAFYKLSALSAPYSLLEEAYKEGYIAGEHLSIDFPWNFDMIVKDIDDGWQVSFIVDK